MAEKTNWKRLLVLTAAIAGLTAAAVFYVRRLKAQGRDVEGAIDDIVKFCRDKAGELDKLIREFDTVAAGVGKSS